MRGIVRFALVVAVATLSATPALSSKRHRAAHVSTRAPVAVAAPPPAPACQGGYLAQTQAQDYLRDDIWVLQPVPDASNRAYRFNCRPN
jgi:hypothetical protein